MKRQQHFITGAINRLDHISSPMSSRQHSVSRVFSMKKSRSSKKRKLTPGTTNPPSPLLLKSEEAEAAQDCPSSNTNGVISTDGDCKEDTMQVRCTAISPQALDAWGDLPALTCTLHENQICSMQLHMHRSQCPKMHARCNVIVDCT